MDGLSACLTASAPSSNAIAGVAKPTPPLIVKMDIYGGSISFSFNVGFWDIAELAGERGGSENTSGLTCKSWRKK